MSQNMNHPICIKTNYRNEYAFRNNHPTIFVSKNNTEKNININFKILCYM